MADEKTQLRAEARMGRAQLAAAMPDLAARLAAHAGALPLAAGSIIGAYHALPDEADPAELLKALAATGKPLIVVLQNGSALAVNWAEQHANAILDAWYPGEEGGDAIAQTLAGDNNPAGRLPVTFYKSMSQIPPFTDYSMQGRTYRYFTGKPLFPFGYGLSYTSFDIGTPQLSATTIPVNGSVTVNVPLRNTGRRAGDEVVQLYIRDEVSSVTRPIKELKGFQKVFLQPGETKTVALDITPGTLAFYDIHMKYVVEPGEFEIMAGNSSRNEDLQKAILTVAK